ncbi:MAG: antiviral reverse transcriptase Drt3b, partial [Mesorhizobium sp.]
FPHMTLMDISKCFSSIYTHSISWAVKGTEHTKDNLRAMSFSSEFDKLMQRMNYNETNGICIGPEVSRIFAEMILNAVDRDIEREAHRRGFKNGIDYECRRYVDDYILFSRNLDISDELYRITEETLSNYNLHLNETKLQRYNRPFLTPKSHTINSAKVRLQKFFESVTTKVSGRLVPTKIHRPDALVRSLVSTIKSGCYEEGVGYDMVANYVIASLVKRIERLCGDFSEVKSDPSISTDLYAPLLSRLLEAVFFFYTVEPTVPSSFHVGRAVLVIWRFIKTELPDEAPSISVQMQRWVSQLARQHGDSNDISHRSTLPIEFLNVIIAAAEVDQFQRVSGEMLEKFIFNPDREDYFSLVSCLFYIKDEDEYKEIRHRIAKKILKILGDCSGALYKAHDAHLAMDTICCPFLPMHTRVKVLGKMRQACSLPNRTRIELEADVTEIAQTPWFVQWQGLDILNMIRKKELSAVY